VTRARKKRGQVSRPVFTREVGYRCCRRGSR
jgi:hypothetical protein